MAALNVHTGEVLATDAVRNDADNFIGFLDQIDMLTPDELIVHFVLDNGASHVAKKTKAWLADHPRFVVHHTPKHASWLNQVELFFSILSRNCSAAATSPPATNSSPASWPSSTSTTAQPDHSPGPTTAHPSRSHDMSITSARVHWSPSDRDRARPANGTHADYVWRLCGS